MADSKVVVKKGDVAQADEHYIAHQCNCTSPVVIGAARAIFLAFPVAGWYLREIKEKRPEVATILVTKTGGKTIINMFAQYYPGTSKYFDRAENRLHWFVRCLNQITDEIEDGAHIAMPYGIGCGLAGGDMNSYMAAIETWSQHPKIGKVVLYDIN